MTDKNLQEILSGEEEKIRQMLGDLKRVDAPNDFDFRLKASIAAAEPRAFQPRLFRVLRIAAPLGLAIAVLAFFVISGLFTVDNETIAPIADSAPNPVENVPINAPTANSENFVANLSNVETFPLEPKNERRDAQTTGGSRDSASTNPNGIRPLGFNSNKTNVAPNDFRNPNPFSVKESLSALGIEANFSGNGWRVQSVKPNSIAERSEIKPNDIIEAIDDTKISTETIRTNSISGKKITVVRDGKKFEIVLQ